MKALADAAGPLSLTDLSTRCALQPAKAHRYLASMVQTEMVVHRRSGLYDLGPLAADLGLAALARIDDVNKYADVLPALVDRTGLPAILAVWTNFGPIVLRLERHKPMFRHSVSTGSMLRASDTTIGDAFLSYLPERLTVPVLARETGIDAHAPAGHEALASRGKLPDADGLFRGPCVPMLGSHTVARAMLDFHGEARCVIALVGDAAEDVDIASHATRELLDI